MQMFLTIVFVALVPIIVIAMAMMPRRTKYSWFELERRHKQGDIDATLMMRRRRLIGAAYGLKVWLVNLLVIAIVLVAILGWGWATGIMIAISMVLASALIARNALVKSRARRLYARLEPRVFQLLERVPLVAPLLDIDLFETSPLAIASAAELRHLLAQSRHILSADQRNLLINGVEFSNRTVSDVMIDRSAIASVRHDELIGPLVLDDLHRTGHTHFPVEGDTLDRIIGILSIQSLVALHSHESMRADTVMDKNLHVVRVDDSLEDVLCEFLASRQHMFVVIDDDHRTAGIVTLTDIIEALFGRRLRR